MFKSFIHPSNPYNSKMDLKNHNQEAFFLSQAVKSLLGNFSSFRTNKERSFCNWNSRRNLFNLSLCLAKVSRSCLKISTSRRDFFSISFDRPRNNSNTSVFFLFKHFPRLIATFKFRPVSGLLHDKNLHPLRFSVISRLSNSL